MRLKSIKLNNIGLYKSKRIEFPYGGKNNRIIVWGNNGAGKTTLINSVKVGLLGKAAVQMTFPEYCNYVKNSLISNRCDIQDEKASVEIEFELNDNHQSNIYRIVRTWFEENEVFNENDYIYQDGMELNVDEKDHIKNVIARAFPPSLLDVIIFDGENAIKILNEGKMSILIKDILYSVFGMDIYSALSKDLSGFLRSAKSNSDISTSEQLDFIKIESEYKAALKNFKKLDNLYVEQNKKRIDKLREINFTVKRFSEKTGIDVQDIEELNKNLSHADLNKEKMNADLKHIYEEILPLKMVHGQIRKIVEKLDGNQAYKALKNINFLKNYFSDDNKAEDWLNHLSELLPKDIPSFAYDLSENDIQTIREVNLVLNQYTKEEMLKAIDLKNDYLKEIRAKIEIANKTESTEAKELLEKLENLYNEFDAVSSILETLEKEKNESEEILTTVKNEYQILKTSITKQKKESSGYVSALQYRDVIDEFIEDNTKKICERIDIELLEYLHAMKFRNDSIGTVVISPKTFEINLFEKSGEIIPSILFSAGEKQVLLGLVLKAALSVSNIDCFFLFDTPVGRLDKKNREIFTKEVIFSISDQAIIFATDSDYSENDYQKIRSNITSEYRLVRDEKDRIVAKIGSIYK